MRKKVLSFISIVLLLQRKDILFLVSEIIERVYASRCVTNARTYSGIRKYVPFRTGIAFLCMRARVCANRFRIVIPLQIDRGSVTLITSFFFLSPSCARPRVLSGVWPDGISMGHHWDTPQFRPLMWK